MRRKYLILEKIRRKETDVIIYSDCQSYFRLCHFARFP